MKPPSRLRTSERFNPVAIMRQNKNDLSRAPAGVLGMTVMRVGDKWLMREAGLEVFGVGKNFPSRPKSSAFSLNLGKS